MVKVTFVGQTSVSLFFLWTQWEESTVNIGADVWFLFFNNHLCGIGLELKKKKGFLEFECPVLDVAGPPTMSNKRSLGASQKESGEQLLKVEIARILLWWSFNDLYRNTLDIVS